MTRRAELGLHTLAPPHAVIFDMDGTLTRPQFDFDLIRREIGIASGPILETVALLSGAARTRADAILIRHETRHAETSELQPGAADLLAELRRRRIPHALMTRNSAASVRVFQARHRLQFDHVWTRESGPFKPSPEPVRQLCAAMSIAPSDTWVVGDYLYDVQSGAAAGAPTVLLLGDGEAPAWTELAHLRIRSLQELLPLLG